MEESTHLEKLGEPSFGDYGKFSWLCEYCTQIAVKVVDDATQSSQLILPEPDTTKQKCTDCTSEFKTEKDYLVHQSIHGTELKCNACDKLFHCKLT